MKKTILVIGANSALAKSMMPVLAKESTIITGGRRGCDVKIDLLEDFAIPKDVDVVLNCAAAFGGTSDEEISNAWETNVFGALRICLAAKAAGVKHLVLISSMSAVHDEASPYYSAYAITKKQADELARYYCEVNRISLTILRPTQIYGVGNGFAKHQPFFYDIIAKAQAGEDILIYGNHDARRNYLHAADLSETINRVIEKQVEGIYPCMYPDNVAYSEIAQTAQKVFGKGGAVEFLKDKPDTPDNTFTKDLSIYDIVNYQPNISLERGIAMIKKYRGSKS